MASADEYAAWIVANQDKKGSEDFNTVAKAYEEAKAEEAQQAKVGSEGAPNEGYGTPPSFMGGLALGAGQVPITLGSMIPGAPTREEMAATLEQRVRDVFPGEPSQLGRIPAETIFTLPVGAGLGAAAKAVPFLRGLAPALETGGFARDLSLLQRATGGAATGGVAGGLLGGGEEVGTGAGAGAALSAVAPPVVSGAARIAGRMFEPETSAALKAAEIARQAASAEGRMPAVEAALRQAGDEFTGRQAVEPAFSPTLQALGAAAEAARPATFGLAAREQLQGAKQELGGIAGGATATEARRFRENADLMLRRMTDPMREGEINFIRDTTEKVAKYRQEQAKFASAAEQKAEDVRRWSMTGAEVAAPPTPTPLESLLGVTPTRELNAAERAGARARTTYTVPGQPPVPGRYTYMGELQKFAERKAGEAAEANVLFGNMARDRQYRLDAMKAEGLGPLDISSVTNQLRAEAAAPGARANDLTVKTMTRLANKMDKLVAENGGYMDPRDWYELRKSGVNDIIDSLTRGQERPDKDRVQGLLIQAKDAMDAAMERAGATGWKNYLDTFAAGRRAVEKRELADEARQLFNKSPAEYVRLMKGENPDFVEKIMGPGNYEIAAVLGKEYAPMANISNVVERNMSVAEQAKLGQTDAAKLLQQQRPLVSRLLALAPKGNTAKEMLDLLRKNNVQEEIINELAKGFETGRTLRSMLARRPVSERNFILRALNRPEDYPLIGRIAGGAAVSQAVE